jgi:VanZ family protein
LNPDAPPAVTGWRVLLAALLVGICWLAFSPAPPPELDTGWDKSNHSLAFSTLAVMGCLAFPDARRRYAILASGLLAFGVFIELVQTQIPSRSADVLDVLADGVGIGAGLLIMRAWQRLRPG